MNGEVRVHPNVSTMFLTSVVTLVGNRKNTCFWMDRRLNGESISSLALALVSHVPKSILNRWTVKEALTNHQWVDDIKGVIPNQAFYEYILIWDML